MSAEFFSGGFCGFLIGMFVGAAMVLYRVIWVEKWQPPKRGGE